MFMHRAGQGKADSEVHSSANRCCNELAVGWLIALNVEDVEALVRLILYRHDHCYLILRFVELLLYYAISIRTFSVIIVKFAVNSSRTRMM